MIEKRVISSLREWGPMTGGQLLRRTGEDVFRLWQTCRNSDAVVDRIAGRRFLRLDRAVEGYARLSPSIRREFQTYTLLGLKDQVAGLEERARRLVREGVLLCGSAALFWTVKDLLVKRRIPEKLDLLEDRVRRYRRRAEDCLRDLEAAPGESEFSNLFFTQEERLEETFDDLR